MKNRAAELRSTSIAPRPAVLMFNALTAARPTPPSVRGRGRQLLLGAARDLFAERGFKGTSSRDIAERAGVSEVMIFRHFGTKANLFQESVVEPFTTFMQDYIDDYHSREHGKLSPEEEGLYTRSCRFFLSIAEYLRASTANQSGQSADITHGALLADV